MNSSMKMQNTLIKQRCRNMQIILLQYKNTMKNVVNSKSKGTHNAKKIAAVYVIMH